MALMRGYHRGAWQAAVWDAESLLSVFPKTPFPAIPHRRSRTDSEEEEEGKVQSEANFEQENSLASAWIRLHLAVV